MRIKRFVAPDMRTALKMVREEHGPDAVILSNKAVGGGIEVVAATDYDEALVQQALRQAADEPERPLTALDAMPALVPVSLPLRAAENTPTAPPQARTLSRADAMIAALAGNSPQAAATRSALAERARSATRHNERIAPPAAALRDPPGVEPVAPAAAFTPVTTHSPGDDFRALLASLADEASASFSPRAAELARGSAEPVQAARIEHAHSKPAEPDVSARREELAESVHAETPQVETDAAATAPTNPRPTPVEGAVEPDFESFAKSPAPASHAPVAERCAEPFDPLAEMAAAQVPPPAPVAPAVAAPRLQLVEGASEDPGIVAMRNELSAMREMMERQMGQFAVERLRGSPARALAFETLQDYGCDDALAQEVAARIDARLDLDKVKPTMLGELARMLTIARTEPLEAGGVFALIGPTGAGKTTTIAKLAARYAQRHRARDVALVTTDVERPGAREQLHALGRRLGVTVREAEGPSGLGEALDNLADYPLVLVDTAGHAARDRALLGQVTWLRATRGLRNLLVLPANLQMQDMAEAVRRYRMAQPEAVVMTKLDETGRLGSAISVAIRHGLPLAYTTAGQEVPADLEVADASRMVLQIERLRRAAENPLATEERQHVVA